MDIFISYSHHDKSYARDIAERLEKSGLSYLLDEKLDTGAYFEGEIKSSLRLCKEVFCLVSPKSLESKWVFVEYGAAWALGKHISPILLACSAESLPDILKPLQAKDYEHIEEIIDSCQKRVSIEPDLRGKWKYNFLWLQWSPQICWNLHD